MAEAVAALCEFVCKEPGVIGAALTKETFRRLTSTGEGPAWNEALARLVLRSKVWGVRRKAELLSSYTPERCEEVLASFRLPVSVAAACGLGDDLAAADVGQDSDFTWLDAVRQLQKAADGKDDAKPESPLGLWERVERHPITQYVPAQCQSCGKVVPDHTHAPDDPNLTEAEPTDSERPFVRAGWFRGPRKAVVFVYRCPDCGSTSRWFRAIHPEITLNPRRWGRLCGEQEDLKAWLAKFLGVRLRVCCPLDWDHVWTEAWDGSAWRPLDPNCVNFARRLHEGIGSWTGVVAIGTPLSGEAVGATADVTADYFALAGGTTEESETWRGMVAAARDDPTGALTQSHTICGHVLQRAGFDDRKITAELRRAQACFDAGQQWWDLAADGEAVGP